VVPGEYQLVIQASLDQGPGGKAIALKSMKIKVEAGSAEHPEPTMDLGNVTLEADFKSAS
jgi:hypothetical protein